jgi:hypothetical protein
MCGSRRFAVLGKYPFRNHFIPRTVCAIIVAAVLKICVGHGVGPRGKRTGGAATLLGKKATGAPFATDAVAGNCETSRIKGELVSVVGDVFRRGVGFIERNPGTACRRPMVVDEYDGRVRAVCRVRNKMLERVEVG